MLKEYKNKDLQLILPDIKANPNPYQYVPGNKTFDLGLGNEGVLVNGSIMRGLSLGNNQNAIVNANLNLQLSGRINNDVDILVLSGEIFFKEDLMKSSQVVDLPKV